MFPYCKIYIFEKYQFSISIIFWRYMEQNLWVKWGVLHLLNISVTKYKLKGSYLFLLMQLVISPLLLFPSPQSLEQNSLFLLLFLLTPFSSRFLFVALFILRFQKYSWKVLPVRTDRNSHPFPSGYRQLWGRRPVFTKLKDT